MSDETPDTGPQEHDEPGSDIPDFIRQQDSSPDDFDPGEFAAPEPANVPLALAAGILVAALGGGLWAFVVSTFNVELGLIAWGIGLVVGLAMIAVAKHGNMQLGVAAAGIAFVGLVVGKLLIAQFGLAYSAVDTIVEDPNALSNAVYHDMVENDEVDPQVVEYYETATEESQPGPALTSKLAKTELDITSRVENMSPAEKERVAKAYADAALGEVSWTEKMGFSGWDLLWFGLAIYTAFRICVTGSRKQLG